MTSLPLHPAIVHLPLGLAFVIPALAAGLAFGLVESGRAAHGSLSSRFRPCCSAAGSSP
jgi:uncharacterized membrane protein